MHTKSEFVAATHEQQWIPWPVSWSSIWVGALASIAAMTVAGLLSTALGASSLERIQDFSTWKNVSLIDMIAAVLGAFLSFVIGGWVTGKIAGIQRAEPAILHAVIAWLVALPLVLASLALGAGKAFGGWYSGIAGSPRLLAAAGAPLPPEVIRHYALAGVTAVLLGLMGAVIGGWMASGEPMSVTHHRTRATNVRRERGG